MTADEGPADLQGDDQHFWKARRFRHCPANIAISLGVHFI